MGSECLENVGRKLAICRALLGLLSDRTLDAVRPADLCAAAGVSRSTLYRHFSGIEQIPMWYRDYGAEIGMFQIGRRYTCAEGHSISIRLLAEAAPLYSYFNRSPRTHNAEFNYAAANSHVAAMRDVLCELGLQVDRKVAYELEALAYGSCVAVSSWMNRGMDLPVGDIVDVVLGLYPQHLREAFDRPCDPRGPYPLMDDLMRLSGA